MIKPLKLTLVAATSAALLFTGCSKDSATTGGGTTASAPAAGAENPNLPVAKYNDVTITLKEVDEKLAPQLKQLEKQKLEMRMQAAEQLALEKLIGAEAKKVGQTDEQWVKAQLEAKLPPPAEADIQKVFDENKDKMPPGATVDSMRQQIIGFLQKDKQKEVLMGILDEVKTKAKFQMLLEEPRVQVAAIGPARGPEGAKITIVEFSDFECPFCGRAEESVSQVMEKYAGKVRLVFRHFPLDFHPNAPKAAEASMCANDQGKFWEMHKVLFANRSALSVDDLKKHAATIGLDAAKFAECLDGGKMKAVVEKDKKDGAEVGVNGTPAFFINGKLLSGAQPFSEFEKVIDAELKKGG
ncbi:MAG: thioredoxin domain-containing protein [Myxococcota bacterium]